MKPGLRDLYEAARKARENSHSPYSGHKVGAALRTGDGRVYAGCNVENSSYGATVCAERGAIQAAVASQGRFVLKELLVLTDVNPPWPPCGLCRQVISEFADPDLMIHAINLNGDTYSIAFKDLVPQAFTPAHLGK